MFIIYAILIAGLFLGTVWTLANLGIIWTFVPANTVGITIARGNAKLNKAGIGGSELVDIIHGVPGMKLDRSNSNPIEWTLKEGKEKHGLLYALIKVHYIGPLNKVRENQIHEMRFGKMKEGDNDKFGVESKDYQTKFVFYSREQAVEVENADTKGAFELDIKDNLLYKTAQPAKAILNVANANAVLTLMVREAVNNVTGNHEAEYFIQGDGTKSSKKTKKELTDAIMKIRGRALEVIGIDIYEVNLVSLDFDAKTRELMELKEKTERENAARLLVSENETKIAEEKKKQKILDNDALADHVKRVIVPTGSAPGGAAVRFAEAYENNKTATTVVLGGNGVSQLIGGNDGK